MRMSDSESTTSSKRARTSSAILIVTLIVFATIVVAESSSLEWPLATDLGKLLAPFHSSNSANSSLLVSATSFLPSVNTCTTFFCSSPNFSTNNQPIVNADVVVKTFGQNPLVVAKNYTNSQGQRFFQIRPGEYQLYFTSNTVNLTTPITASPGNTTELDITVNETLYHCTFIDISNPVSPTLIAPWNDIFLNIQSNSAITQNVTESLFLIFLAPGQGALALSNSSQRYSVSVLGQYYANTAGTQWLEVELNSVAKTPSAYEAYVLTYLSSYTTREYPMNATTGAT
jgi:hypothetical protein